MLGSVCTKGVFTNVIHPVPVPVQVDMATAVEEYPMKE
jgi:hypothetical protein